uniref:ApoC-IB n=1 Tax=Ascaris lumbricoides TaxID=6252 RepID=A0A0M3IGX5_ASCLU
MRAVCVLLAGSALLMVFEARPPTPEEVKEQQMNEFINDYDTLPAISLIPESWKENLKKEKMRYLEMLQQHGLK